MIRRTWSANLSGPIPPLSASGALAPLATAPRKTGSKRPATRFARRGTVRSSSSLPTAERVRASRARRYRTGRADAHERPSIHRHHARNSVAPHRSAMARSVPVGIPPCIGTVTTRTSSVSELSRRSSRWLPVRSTGRCPWLVGTGATSRPEHVVRPVSRANSGSSRRRTPRSRGPTRRGRRRVRGPNAPTG